MIRELYVPEAQPMEYTTTRGPVFFLEAVSVVAYNTATM